MSFDPTEVDLSFVEPGLRDDVLRRIVVLEEFSRSRGAAARIKACDALGISEWQLYTLARAWSARRRAEDVTLRATKRVRPSSLHQDLLEIIGLAADACGDSPITEIAARVELMAKSKGLDPPSYPTINKYVREHQANSGGATITALGCDLVADVIVSDIPVQGTAGARSRPQVLTMIDGRTPRLVGMSGTVGKIDGHVLADCIVDIACADADAFGVQDARAETACVMMLIPDIDELLPESLAAILEEAGVQTTARPRGTSPPGKAASALLGHSLAGYKLRPRLACRPEIARGAGYPKVEAKPLDAAVAYLAAVANDGREPAVSPLASLGPQRLKKLAADLRRWRRLD